MFDALVSWENLLAAFRKAAAGKRGRADVAAFEHRLEENLLVLQEELRAGTYRPGGYHSFHIHEPKRRLISAAPFRDRVVHHALCNLIEPLFERSFSADSFANRRGKGTHRALRHCQLLARRHRHVLQCDVRQFFPSIDHEVLRTEIERKVKDGQVLHLVDQILASGRGVQRACEEFSNPARGAPESPLAALHLLDVGPATPASARLARGARMTPSRRAEIPSQAPSEEYEMVYFPGDVLFAVNRPRGIPIGNLTSQFWANVYLSPVDHFVKRELRCPGYVRYVDDLLLFADDKALLWRMKAELERRLERLRLTIHAGAHPRPVTEGIPFLGFVTFPNRRRLKRRKGIAFRRRLKRLQELEAAGELPAEQVRASVAGWVGHVRYGNTVGLRKAILSECRD